MVFSDSHDNVTVNARIGERQSVFEHVWSVMLLEVLVVF